MTRPPKISIERVSRNTVYECLLHAAAVRKDELKQSLLGMEAVPRDSGDMNVQSAPPIEQKNKTCYEDDVAEIILRQKPKDKKSKKN